MKLKSILTLVAAIALGFNAIAANLPKKEVGIQLYSVRQMLDPGAKYEGNVAGLMKELAKMGYTQFEAANYGDGKFYGLTPQQFSKAAADAGTKVTSSHTGRPLNDEELRTGNITDFYAYWDKVLDDHKAAGIEYVVLPWMNVPSTLADLQKQCDALNEIGRRAAAKGIKFGYHNHSHEFNKVEDKVMIDYMIENTDPKNVLFELDVYWAMMGHASPVDYFNKYPGRFKLLHIKDRREIGQSGMVGFDAIFNNASTAGLEKYYVEIEEYTDGMEKGAKESVDYLLAAPYVKPAYSKK
ncbi:MAG: sugar phosphate isomerase/epimerase [Bacteroidales bacterium]|nr:sugar phosphate isomerase/epimerase [Bacteroidales bacterium]